MRRVIPGLAKPCALPVAHRPKAGPLTTGGRVVRGPAAGPGKKARRPGGQLLPQTGETSPAQRSQLPWPRGQAVAPIPHGPRKPGWMCRAHVDRAHSWFRLQPAVQPRVDGPDLIDPLLAIVVIHGYDLRIRPVKMEGQVGHLLVQTLKRVDNHPPSGTTSD